MHRWFWRARVWIGFAILAALVAGCNRRPAISTGGDGDESGFRTRPERESNLAPEPETPEELIDRVIDFYQEHPHWTVEVRRLERWPRDLESFTQESLWQVQRQGPDHLAVECLAGPQQGTFATTDGNQQWIGFRDPAVVTSGDARERAIDLLDDAELHLTSGRIPLDALRMASARDRAEFLEGYAHARYLGRRTQDGEVYFRLELTSGERRVELWIAAEDQPRIEQIERIDPLPLIPPAAVGRKRTGPAKLVTTREWLDWRSFDEIDPAAFRGPAASGLVSKTTFAQELDVWSSHPLIGQPLPLDKQGLAGPDGRASDVSDLLSKPALWLIAHPDVESSATAAEVLRKVHVDYWQRNVEVIVVMPRVRRDLMAPWMARHQLTRFPGFTAPNRLETAWSIPAVPMLLLTDAEGVVRRVRWPLDEGFERQVRLDLEALFARESHVAELVRTIEASSLPVELLGHLGHSDPRVVQATTQQLVRLGGTSVFALVEGLNHDDEIVRLRSVQLLTQFPSEAAAAMPALLAALEDDSASVRAQASISLAALGDSALGPLVAALESASPRARSGAARSLGLLGTRATPAAGPLINRLADPDEFVREQVARALIALGPEVLDLVGAALLDPDPQVHAAARSVLVGFGPRAVEHLVDSLQHDLPHIRRQVTLAADAMDEASQARLRTALVARGTIERLPELGPEELVIKLESQEAFVREAVQREVTRRGETIVPALVARLDAAEPVSRAVAADALKQLGPAALPAVPVLVARLGDSSAGVRRVVGESLAELGTPALLSLLEAIEKDPSERQRLGILETLGRMGPKAEPAIATIVTSLESGRAPVREAAAKALATMGPPGIDALTEAITRDESAIHEPAARGLAHAGAEAIEPLIGLLSHQKSHVRIWAATALGTIGPDAREALDRLRTIRSDDANRSVRSYADWAIKKIDRS